MTDILIISAFIDACSDEHFLYSSLVDNELAILTSDKIFRLHSGAAE